MRRWTLRCWKRDRRRDWIYAAQHTFFCDVEMIEDAWESAHAAGFACLQKVAGRITPSAQLSVRISSQSPQELLIEVIENTLNLP